MLVAVIKDTSEFIISGDFNQNTIVQNAINAGFTAEQVEILTQAEYDARKALEPQPEVQPSEIEVLKQRTEDLELILTELLLGGM